MSRWAIDWRAAAGVPAREAGIGISVCGDAAADPQVLPLLLGVGVRTVSVGAAKVPQVADWITQVNAAKAERHVG